MSLNYLRIDSAIINEVAQLEHLATDYYEKLMLWSLSTLQGKEEEVLEHVTQLSQELGANPSKLAKIVTAVAALQWECAKFASKDVQTIREMLLQLGVPLSVAEVFCEVFYSNRRLFLKLKGCLGVSEFSYYNLSWRLDVELAKRNLSVTSDPKYLLRLDLINHAADTAVVNRDDTAQPIKPEYHSVLLQADYANMKLLQSELQRALDEMNNVHCQRISRYIT